MKTQNLSSFQKQQYTQYLQSQLQKFSTFMLTQKKQNQNYKYLTQMINQQSNTIQMLSGKIKLLETYQRQNFQHCQRLQNSNIKNVELENRLRKVESIYFESNQQIPITNTKNLQSNTQNNQYKNFKTQVNKKINLLQKQIKQLCMHHQFSDIIRDKQNLTRNQTCNIQTNIPTEILATKKELRQIQDCIYTYFNKKFNKIQKMVKKSLQTPLQVPYKKPSPTKTRLSDKMPSQEQIIGYQNNNDYNDLNMLMMNHNNDNSICISDNSYRMKPIQYYSQKSVEKNIVKPKKKVKKNNKRSISKSSNSAISQMNISISKSKKNYEAYYKNENQKNCSKSKTNSKSRSKTNKSNISRKSNISKKSNNQSLSIKSRPVQKKTAQKKTKKLNRRLSPAYKDPKQFKSHKQYQKYLQNVKEYPKVCKKKHF